jgi:hypothetical protein
MVALLGAGPWALVSQHVYQRCGPAGCQIVTGAPKRYLVQRFATEAACRQALEPMHQHLRDTEGVVNEIMAAQRPRTYVRTTTTFLCEIGGTP